MDIPIITAFISGGSAAVAAITVAAIQHRKTAALLAYRLSQLEAKVDKHNNLVERTYELEARADVTDTRITNLEKGRG